jgi:hypothetical protein
MRLLAWSIAWAVLLTMGTAQAADWTAVKLHGMVYADAGGGNWVRLSRGAAVADGRAIRTLASGNAVFARGAETVAFGPNTEGEITDRPGQRPFTIVLEQAGTVAVSAEARAVRHFSVETPYLVAVVKGTQFTVRTTPRGSQVTVLRGLVSVTTRPGGRTVLLPAGQSVAATAYGDMLVSGTAIPSLVHPRIGNLLEDAADAGGDGSEPPIAGSAGVTSLGEAAGTVGATLGGAIGSLGDTAGATVGGLSTAVGGTVSAVGSSLGGIADSSGTLGGVGTIAGSTVTAAGSAVSGLGGAAGSTVSAAGGAVGGVVTGVTGSVGDVVGGLTQSSGSVSGKSPGTGLLGHLGL